MCLLSDSACETDIDDAATTSIFDGTATLAHRQYAPETPDQKHGLYTDTDRTNTR